MSKNIWVRRRVGKYSVGAWIPVRLVALGGVLYLVLALLGLFRVATQDQAQLEAQRKAWLTCFYQHERDGSTCGPKPEGL